MFEGQPKGLWALAFANTGERFGYYTMLAVFALFLGDKFGFSSHATSEVFSWFLSFVYFLPLVGGMAADRWGYSRMVTIGMFVMFFGYLLLSVSFGSGNMGIAAMVAALTLVCLGTGLFKGNLQVMIGDLYQDPKYADKRDAGFSLFYMMINVGALFAPTAAILMMDWAMGMGFSKADAYHFAFAVACVSVVVSIAIYYGGMATFRHVAVAKKANKPAGGEKTETVVSDEKDTKERIVCLCLVYAVVLFFWMAFHQNGLTLTWFASEYTYRLSRGWEAMMFDVTNLVAVIFIVFALFSLFKGKTMKARAISAALIAASVGFLWYKYDPEAVVRVNAPIFQHFNPCFVVMLTPVSIAFFGWLARKGKEPKAPVKIGLGMLVAAGAYLLMMVSSIGLPLPNHPFHVADVTPNLLVGTYFILTIAELLLSPIGISFVTKVSPEKYKGMMMGGWFVATALGNKLVSIPGHMWGIELTYVWGTLMGICLLAALFIFSIIKKLNKVS
jgi:POT family proton-dependent oligopeptide transporter